MDTAQAVARLHVDHPTRIACPECSQDRKKAHQKDMSISLGDKGWIYYCHHCGIEGLAPYDNIQEHIRTERKYMPSPAAKPITPTIVGALEEEHYAYLATRGISKKTADDARLFASTKYFARLNERTAAIGFPYYKAGNMVAAKYRSIKGKDFTQESGSAQDLYGIDDIDPAFPIIIVEGEIDRLTGMECGLRNVVSVPSGAPMKVSDGKVEASEDKKFGFVWSAFDILSKAPYIVIATDNDTAGQALCEELARRIGKEKCRVAKFGQKDINQLFTEEGADAVIAAISTAEPFPVAGLSGVSKFADRLEDLWDKGTGKGESTGYPDVDEVYTIAAGQLSVVTGYPSSGKSNFVDQLMVNLARSRDWKFAICSFENQPEVQISRLMEIYKEKRFFDGSHRMTKEEKDEAFKWVEQHFVFMDSETVEPATIDSILERAKIAVARMGIRGLVIDPYNYIDNKSNSSETEFISSMLTRVQAFAKAYGVHVWFVAHPAKITRSGMDLPRPDGMAISGSMAWWAKADCGITVHRGKFAVEIAVWKCRYRWVGTQGEAMLTYNPVTGTYIPLDDPFR